MSGIFLGFTADDMSEKRLELYHVIQKAGIQVFPSDITYNHDFFPYVSAEINKAECAVIILGNVYGENFEHLDVSISHYQYIECFKQIETNKNFKLFIWCPASVEAKPFDARQTELINDIRNNIKERVYFTNVNSPIQLVDDLRTSLKKEDKETFDINPTDVFIIYNQLDDFEANEVADMLSDIIPIEKLNIIQDSDIDYSEFCAQQMVKSKLAVIYFKESSDWALPFAQQVWKKVGGASSHTPILLIGDENPETNMNKKFKAPKVISLIISGELIPLEIKVQYDKVIELK